MGLFDGLTRIKDPIRGSAQVISTSQAPHGAMSANCWMNLVVSVPGYQAFAVEEQYIVRVSKWPQPGQVLPVEVSAADFSKMKILWDEVVEWQAQAQAQAQQIVSAMNQQPVYPPAGGGSGPQTSVVYLNGQPATPEQVAQVEALTGMDLDGNGVAAGASTATNAPIAPSPVPGAPSPTAAAPSPEEERIALLERLAQLHRSGAITTAEFQAEKARLFGE